MQYEKPILEFWDLDEEGIVVTSLDTKPENSDDGDNNGDFDGGDVAW